nr:hypothetical protein [Streptomyces avicenniae]
MGWTHDYRDVARDRSGAGAAAPAQNGARRFEGAVLHDSPIGFPDLLRRRARWVGVRLRHPRG